MIKNIIFDFGDVFLNLDKKATEDQLRKLGLHQLSDAALSRNQEYEKGGFSSEDFVADYCREFPALNAQSFVACWNAILVDFPKYRLEFLQELVSSGRFRLFLLSNTNDLHIDWVKQQIVFFEEFRACFEAFYLSQELGLRKPDPAIFDLVLNRHDLRPEETLFIDDTPENTRAAEKLGIHTWTIDPEKEDVTDLLTIKSDLF